MIRIAIAEDDPAFRSTITGYISRYSEENHCEISSSVFSDGSALLFHYEPIYDILLLDIEMPKTDGMEAARKIRQIDPRVIIIFITNMAQYAINGYEVGALDFVLKPVKYFSFSMKLTKAISSVRQSEDAVILVPNESGMTRLFSGDIIYAEIRDHWLYIITSSKSYKMLATLKDFADKMKKHHFICCSNAYCINLKYVTDFQKDTLILDGKYEIRVSRSKKKELRQAILDYYKGGLR